MVYDFFLRFVLLAKSSSVVRRIAWLTMMGLAVSVSSLILVLSVMTAMNHSQIERVLSVEPHLTAEVPLAKSLFEVQAHPVLQALQKLQPMANIFPSETQDVIVRTTDGKFRGAVARGVSLEALQAMLHRIHGPIHDSGEASALQLQTPQPGEVIIGVDLAHILGVFEGDTLLIFPPEGLLLPPAEAPPYERVRVKQVLVSNVADIDAQVIFYIAGKTLKSLHAPASLRYGIEVRLPDAENAEAVKQQLSAFNDIKLQTWRERNSSLFFALRLEKIMIGLFLSMAALIAGLSLVSVLFLLISQKRKEIGLLQAIGYSRQQVRRLFSRIGFLLAFFGIGSGLIIGVGCSLYLQFWPLNILPDIYYDSQIPAEVQPLFVSAVSVVALLLAYVGAKMAVHLSITEEPAKALRQKA